MKIVIQKEWFSVEQCEANPNKLYVFGDNAQRIGKAGQAQIRDCFNSFGIATKRTPSKTEDAYFHDNETDAYELILNDIFRLMKIFIDNKFEVLVFPYDGLGTGLSKLPEKAPILYNEMIKALKYNFKVQGENYELI